MGEVGRDVLRIAGAIVVRQITRRIREGRVAPKTNKGGTTLVKRGMLLRSIKSEILGSTVVVSAGGADVPYARIMHEGGVIRPKHAKYLAIPLTPKAALYKPRDYPTGEGGGTFIAKGVIFLNQGEGQKPLALYVLKKSVTMPARPYMLLDPHDMNVLRDAVEERVQREFDVTTNGHK